MYYKLLAIVSMIIVSNFCQASDQSKINAVPRITAYVEEKKNEACFLWEEMTRGGEEFPDRLSIDKYVKNLNAWKQICERRRHFLETLNSGDSNRQLETIEIISKDQGVKDIIKEEEEKLHPQSGIDIDDPLGGVL